MGSFLQYCSHKLRLELCWRKNIYYVLEQPTTSLLFMYKPIKKLLARHGAKFVTCSLGVYGAPTLKPVSWQRDAKVQLLKIGWNKINHFMFQPEEHRIQFPLQNASSPCTLLVVEMKFRNVDVLLLWSYR